MTHDYGEGGYGEGGYGGVHIGDNNRDVAEAVFDHPVLALARDRHELRLMLVLLAEADRIDGSLADVLDAHQVANASGGSLDRMGLLTNTPRREFEDDDQYRARLIAEGGIARMRPRFDELAPFVRIILDSSYDKLSFTSDLDATPATFEVTAAQSVWDDAPMPRSDIDAYVADALPAGHSFNRVET